MATINDPETRQALQDLGCLIEDDRLDTSAFARLLAEQLEEAHIAQSLDDVASVQTTVGQLVGAVVGRTDEQLIDLAKPLLGAGAKSPVQRALSNGYMLCGSRARIVVDIEGEQKTTSIGTRFLSADHDVIERYVLEPKRRRTESFVRSTLELTGLVTQRQPEIAPRVASFIEQLNVTWQRELGSGS